MSPTNTNEQLSDLGFPGHETDLLALLNHFRNAASLPGEVLGHTKVLQHAIHLMPRSTPSYIRNYLIPHSKRVLLETAAQGMLDQEIVD